MFSLAQFFFYLMNLIFLQILKLSLYFEELSAATTTTANSTAINVYATKAVVLGSVALLGIRLALSALFWDRSVHTYEDLLDSVPKSELHQVNIKKIIN